MYLKNKIIQECYIFLFNFVLDNVDVFVILLKVKVKNSLLNRKTILKLLIILLIDNNY